MSPLVAKGPEWKPSPRVDEELRRRVLQWVEERRSATKDAGSRRGFVLLGEKFVEAVESCPDGAKADFLPAVFAPLFNATGSFPRRQIYEQQAFRLLEWLREDGYPIPQGDLARGKPQRTPEDEEKERLRISERNKLKTQIKRELKMRASQKAEHEDEDDAGEGGEGEDEGEGEGEGGEAEQGNGDEAEVPELEQPAPPERRASQRAAQRPAQENKMSVMEMLPQPAKTAAKAQRAATVQSWVTGTEKLRLWKRNTVLGEKDIHLKDFPGSVVEKYAGLSEFFDQVIRPTFGPFVGQPDVVYYAARVTAQGNESARIEYPMGASQIAAPELGLRMAPGTEPVAAPAQLPPAQSLPGALLDATRTINELDERRFQQTQEMLMRQQGRPLNEREQYEQRIRELEAEAEQLRRAAQAPPPPQFNGSDGAVAALGEIALRAQQQAFNPPVMAAPPQVAAHPAGMPSFMEMMQLMQSQQNATIMLMRELTPKTNPNELPPAMERLVDKMITRMEKLEERIAASEGPGELDRMVHSIRTFQALSGGDSSKPPFAPQGGENVGMMGLLKGFVEKLPETLREYQNTVRTVAAVQHGLSPDAAVQQAQLQQAQQPQRLPPPQHAQTQQPKQPQMTDAELAVIAKRNRRERLPVDLRVAIEKVLSAPTPQLQVESFVELQSVFIDISEKEAKAQEAARAVGRAVEPSPLANIADAVKSRFEVAVDLEAASPEELAKKQTAALAARNDLKAYFAGLFDWIGYGAEATSVKVAEIVENYFMAVDTELAGGDEDDDDGDEADDGDDDAGEGGDETAEAGAADGAGEAAPAPVAVAIPAPAAPVVNVPAPVAKPAPPSLDF